MIAPKVIDRTARQETDAYELATARDNATCVRCLRAVDCQRDHRQNRMRNNTVVENLQLLCVECHDWKTSHPEAANRQGWGCPRWARPAEYPARRWIRTDHGTHRTAWVLYVRDIKFFSHPDGYREIPTLEADARIAGLWEGVAA
jgi:hypothetical protein